MDSETRFEKVAQFQAIELGILARDRVIGEMEAKLREATEARLEQYAIREALKVELWPESAKYHPFGRVILLEDACWAAAITKKNPTGRVPANVHGTVIGTECGAAVLFDNIPAKAGSYFLIGESGQLFGPEEK